MNSNFLFLLEKASNFCGFQSLTFCSDDKICPLDIRSIKSELCQVKSGNIKLTIRGESSGWSYYNQLADWGEEYEFGAVTGYEWNSAWYGVLLFCYEFP